MHALSVLSPVFVLATLGWTLRATGFLPAAFFTGMNRLVFYVALPCLLFVKIAPPVVGTGQGTAWPITVVVWTALAVCLAAGLVAGWIGGLRGPALGAVLQAAFRGNLAFVGLPVVFYALEGGAPGAGEEWARIAVLAIGPVIPVYNICSVFVLLGAQERWSWMSAVRVVGHALTNPLVLACLLGVLYSTLALPVPGFLMRAGTALAGMALPLALLSIGASLSGDRMAKSGWPALMAALIKVTLSPLVGWITAKCLHLGPEQTLMAMIFCACPTAVASYVMAEQFGADADIAAGAVMISTLLSAASLALVITLV